MSFNSFPSRPPTNSSFTSHQSTQYLHSNKNVTLGNHEVVPSRTMSTLKRSTELLSVEEELRELLKNSHLNEKQKKAFSEMLETTFDLFQVPLHNGSHHESLIDTSSIELYSKMQSLVTALTSLIMNEEEATRVDITQTQEQENDEDEFSDDEIPYEPRFDPIEQGTFTRSSTISNFRSLSRRSSIADTTRRSSLMKQSQNNFRPNQSPTNPSLDIRPRPNYNSNRYQDLQSQPHFKPSFQVMETPIPRSFSTRSERPKSMYVGNHDLNSQIAKFSPMSSTRSIGNLHSIVDHPQQEQQHFQQEFGSDQSVGYVVDDYSSRRGSIRASASRSKRYSMRF